LIIFMISSVISLGGYLPMIVKQYQQSPEAETMFANKSQPVLVSKWMLLPAGLLSLLVIVIGIYPSPWVNLVDQVMRWMLI